MIFIEVQEWNIQYFRKMCNYTRNKKSMTNYMFKKGEL